MVQATAELKVGRRRWVILGLGLAAQTASCTFLYGIPFLVPRMRDFGGLTLAEAGTVVSAPSIGLLCTLIAWGAAADRFGERVIMALGLGASGLLLLVASTGGHSLTTLFVLFLLAGACTASVNASSGRVVMGWFSAAERGVAMGIRQTAQPLGVGLAALGLPPLAEHHGFRAAMLMPACFAVVVALLAAWLVRDPPRPEKPAGAEKPASPYRGPTLWRLHGASALLVVPQFAVSAFAPVYLVTAQHWSPYPRAGSSPRCRHSARWGGWRRDTGRTGWAAGCGRCASSRSRAARCCCWWPSATRPGRGSPHWRWCSPR